MVKSLQVAVRQQLLPEQIERLLHQLLQKPDRQDLFKLKSIPNIINMTGYNYITANLKMMGDFLINYYGIITSSVLSGK